MQSSGAQSKRTSSVLGRDYLCMTEAEVCSYVADAVVQGVGGRLVTVNASILRQVEADPEIATLISGADLTADGSPIVWASKIEGQAVPGRVCGSDLVLSLSEAVGAAGGSVFLVGGNPGAAERAADAIGERCPNARVSGVHPLPLGYEQTSAVEDLEAALARLEPSVVFVGLGFPKGELLNSRLIRVLPQAWFVQVGISFSFLAGEVARAPVMVQRLGLEWLHRLVQEPRRLGPRYARDIPFVLDMCRRALSRRLTRDVEGPNPQREDWQ